MPPTIKRQTPVTRTAPTPTSKSERLGVLKRISPIGFDKEDGIRISLYGRSGTGKTTLWSTFPAPILAVICSGGTNPGELRSIDTPENRKRISQVPLEESHELMDLVDHARQPGKFRTIVLDHASGLQDMVLKEILGLDRLPAQKGWGMASQQQWGQCGLQCKELLRALMSLSINVVVVAQEREFKDGDGDDDMIMPAVGSALTPSLTGWLNAASDYIANTFIRQKEEVREQKVGNNVVATKVKLKEVEYCLRTGPHPVYTTKFRVPRGTPLPDVVVDPDYGKIMRLIGGQGL